MFHLLAIAACPDCPPAREARAQVVADGMWLNALYAVLPFVLVLIVVRWFVGRIDGGQS